jgi:hypothetical protein
VLDRHVVEGKSHRRALREVEGKLIHKPITIGNETQVEHDLLQMRAAALEQAMKGPGHGKSMLTNRM